MLPSTGIVITLMAMIAFGLGSMTICLPSMSEWGRYFSEEQSFVQLTFSAFVIAYGFSQVIYGPLSDLYGRRKVALVGFSIALFGSLLASVAENITILIVGRFIQGAGAASGMVIGRAMIQDYFDGKDRARMMAYIGMVMGLCPPLAIIIGGQIHVLFDWRSTFLFISFFGAVVTVAIYKFLPARQKEEIPENNWFTELLSAYKMLLKNPAYLAYVGVVAMSTSAFYIFLTGLPLLLAKNHVGPAMIGWYVAVIPLTYILGNFLASRLLKITSESNLLAAGLTLSLAGPTIVLVFSQIGLTSPLFVTLPLTLMGLGHGLLMPPALAGTVGMIPSIAGAAAGGAGLAQQLAGATGGYVVGTVSHDNPTYLALLLMTSALFAIMSYVLLKFFERSKHSGKDSENDNRPSENYSL